MAPTMRVIQGSLEAPRPVSAIEAAFQHFRLDRQGQLVSAETLRHYDWMATSFFGWLGEVHAEVRRFEQLDAAVVREYRATVATGQSRLGRPFDPETIATFHRRLMAFLRWADDEGYAVDPRILRLKAPRTPSKEATVFHLSQLRRILDACNPAMPQEELAVRILVGSGVRASELVGLAVRGPDGLPDLMLDSMDRGRVELRIRWDAGPKGRKARRVPTTPKLATAIKRCEARIAMTRRPRQS